MEDSEPKPNCSPQQESEETEQAQLAKEPIQAYLQEHLEVYRELRQARDAGHESKDADRYFQNQRSQADYATEKTQKVFFQLMRAIGLELDDATAALRIRRFGTPPPAILDLCMAPGGFSLAALQRNHRSIILRGISLAPSEGGHVIRLRDVSSAKEDINAAEKYVDYRDITLLAEEMGMSLADIPPSHPDAALFSSDRPYIGSLFDLVFCDGQVLRTQERGEHRADHEAVRLRTSRLVLALQRIRSGGTMIILLHRADAWHTVRLIYTFSLFSDSIELFKPTTGHRLRGSFYLVAKGIRPERETAVQAIQRWKALWRVATFGVEAMGEGELGVLGRTDEMEARFVIEQFGSELLRLVEPVFRLQMEALRSAPWMRKGGVKCVGKEVTGGDEYVVESETTG